MRKTLLAVGLALVPCAALGTVNGCSDDTTNVSGGDAATADTSLPTLDGAGEAASDASDGGSCAPAAFTWATSGGGAGQEDRVFGTAQDKDGNVWITGTYIEEAKWGNTTLPSTGTAIVNGFVAKLDPMGKVLFAQPLIGGDDAGAHQVRPTRIRVDAQGNAYGIGTYAGRLEYGGSSPLPRADDNGNVYLVKWDATGKPVWATSCGNGRNQGIDVAVDGKGGVFVTGEYTSPITCGTVTSLPGQDGNSEGDLFVAKFSDTDRAWKWISTFFQPTSDGAHGRGIVANPDGTLLVTGIVQGGVPFGTTTLVVPNDGEGGFLAKLDANGAPLWATQIDVSGTGATDLAMLVAAAGDGAGNVYVAGEFKSDLTLHAASSVGSGVLGDSGVVADGGSDPGALHVTSFDRDALVAKYDASGTPVWARHGGVQNAITRAEDVAFDGQDGVYATGFYQGHPAFDTLTQSHTGSMWLAKWNASGAVQWLTGDDTTANGGSDGYAVTARAGAGVDVGGQFIETTKYGTAQVTSAGQQDGVVAHVCN